MPIESPGTPKSLGRYRRLRRPNEERITGHLELWRFVATGQAMMTAGLTRGIRGL
ncbi:hypothetical protein AB0F43_31410 [Kribbella sp. NPDC023972]|uniref:hypothetical protein n=1 Tax=Kribbella sp. NPDC023972 TaxID=3154795 RepID=UPI0033D7FAC4